MDLLTNAVESIQVGIEDYAHGGRPRLLSAARNIHAGLLLLFKECLRRQSPAGSNEALIKAKIDVKVDRNGRLSVFGSGRKTVDVQQIRERLTNLGIQVDWTRFDKISETRNNIEHYYPRISQDAVKGLVASAFLIIRGFVEHHLGADPRKLFGPETWKILLQVADVYDAEKEKCRTALEAIDWESDALATGVSSVRCDECASDLLVPLLPFDDVAGSQLECRACGATKHAEDFVPEAIADALGWEAYVALTDGGEEPFGQCPECGTSSYVLDEDRCAYCGETQSRECDRCGETIPVSELGMSGLCGYCANIMTKDD